MADWDAPKLRESCVVTWAGTFKLPELVLGADFRPAGIWFYSA